MRVANHHHCNYSDCYYCELTRQHSEYDRRINAEADDFCNKHPVLGSVLFYSIIGSVPLVIVGCVVVAIVKHAINNL